MPGTDRTSSPPRAALCSDSGPIEAIAAPQSDRLLLERLGGWNLVFERRRRKDNNRAFALGNLLKNFQTLSNNLRVGERAFVRRKLEFRKEQGIDLPV